MNKKLVFVLASLTLLPASGFAGVGKLSSAEVTESKFDAQYNMRRTGDDRRSRNNTQQHKFELEYGLTDDWMIGLQVEGNRRTNPGRNELSAYGGEVKYQFSAQEDGWWLNSAIKAEYNFAAPSADADTGETGILFSRVDGKFKTTANFKFEREIGNGRSGGVDFNTALQTVYRCDPHFSPGLEWHGDYGRINDLNSSADQEHYLGAILVGRIFQIEDTQMTYEIGYFRGLTDGSADDAQRFRLKYEIRF